MPQETIPEAPILEILQLLDEESTKWEGIELRNRPKIEKLQQNKETKIAITTMNDTLETTLSDMTTFEELCHKVYCAAKITNIIQGTSSRTPNQENRQQRTPPWKERIERRITTLRKEISVLLVNRKVSKKVEKKVWAYPRKLKIEKDGQHHQHLRTHMETLKRLSGGHSDQQATSPDTNKMQQYWSDTWTQEGSHNTEATWIKAEKSAHLDLTEMTEITITEEDVKATVRRLKNWSVAGVDGIHNFWWKSLTVTHKVSNKRPNDNSSLFYTWHDTRKNQERRSKKSEKLQIHYLSTCDL
ncbi:uncharacterized protein LOC123680263 [Harmonia axyridis]|uniref:uncharacterized protein LOC123680263 n=1 Tax=Harmonia axyridis TaxID=115357 RepID=UPI001E279455|nr:uncharacterized protein LOC123680263 [Harmonia axyridis]